MLNLTIEISAKTISDIEMALDELRRKIGEGYTSGSDGNEDGDYSFDLSGEEELRDQDKVVYRVEYDLEYSGGEYSSVGNFVDVVPNYGEDVEEAFTRVTGRSAMHVIHYEEVEDDDE